MIHISKQLEEWVTRLRNDRLYAAQIKLALVYFLVILIALALITFFIQGIFVTTLKNNIEYQLIVLNYGVEVGEIFLHAAAQHLLTTMVKIDVVFAVLFSAVGYFFAFRTLRPIKYFIDAQKRFVSDAAHELKTPLAVMKTGVETMPNLAKDDTVNALFKKDLIEEIDSLIHITENLLTLSQSDNPDAYRNKRMVNISELLETQLRRISTYADQKNIIVTPEIQPDIIMHGIPDDFVALFRNLLKNAVDYSHAEGSIKVSLKKSTKKIQFCVSDMGIGIPHEEQQAVFSRFYKSDTGEIRSKGSGLGLAIVKSIVDHMGGAIHLESRVGHGTTITLIIPYA